MTKKKWKTYFEKENLLTLPFSNSVGNHENILHFFLMKILTENNKNEEKKCNQTKLLLETYPLWNLIKNIAKKCKYYKYMYLHFFTW